MSARIPTLDIRRFDSDRDAFVQVLTDRGLDVDQDRLDALLETKKALFPQAIGDHTLFPGAAECIGRVAAHVPVAIASGALRSEIELILERSGLGGRFPVIVAAGETPRSKPAPDPYARAFALLDASVQQTGDDEGPLRRQWPLPATDVQKHHGYAFQWFALCTLVAGLYLWFQIIQPRRQRARLHGQDAR